MQYLKEYLLVYGIVFFTNIVGISARKPVWKISQNGPELEERMKSRYRAVLHVLHMIEELLSRQTTGRVDVQPHDERAL